MSTASLSFTATDVEVWRMGRVFDVKIKLDEFLQIILIMCSSTNADHHSRQSWSFIIYH